MITLIHRNKPSDYYPGHTITCKKNIGSFVEGEKYRCALQKCTGRTFKGIEDRKGEKDDRYMLFSLSGIPGYAIDKKSVLDDCFDEV